MLASRLGAFADSLAFAGNDVSLLHPGRHVLSSSAAAAAASAAGKAAAAAAAAASGGTFSTMLEACKFATNRKSRQNRLADINQMHIRR